MSLFCTRCGSENSDDYRFCKICGQPLTEAEPKNTTDSVYDEVIDGVSKEESATFVGKNSYKILSKFSGMELASSRVSWCWPVAVLSFFFGFFGAAIWFFYRKMYKWAFLSVGLATLLCVLRTVFTYEFTVEVLTQMFEMINTVINNPSTDPTVLINEFELYMESIVNSAAGVNVSGILSDLETALSVILGGLFGFYLYKNHTVSKIKKISENYSADPSYKIRLRLSGGVSGGMAFLGVVLMLVISGIISSVPIVAFLVSL